MGVASNLLNQWINVKELLPTHEYSVVGWVIGGRLHFGEDYIDVVTWFPKDKEWRAFSGKEKEDVVVKVSHWMEVSDAREHVPHPRLPEAPEPREHVAWLRYVRTHDDSPTQLRLCNSNDEGAFKVYRNLPELKELTKYKECMEKALGEKLYAVEKLLDHFDEDGNLKGEGQWRIREIYQCCKDFDEGCELAATLKKSNDQELDNGSIATH